MLVISGSEFSNLSGRVLNPAPNSSSLGLSLVNSTPIPTKHPISNIDIVSQQKQGSPKSFDAIMEILDIAVDGDVLLIAGEQGKQ